ncbi:MAG: redoxin domain-containing protein, partial [Cyanobacteria bacterium REEB65]|nr:redoxin domain-containing protein [Cyanobacteria bacterium REEB65]
MRTFAAHYQQFRNANAQVLGIAHDDPTTQHKFRLHCVTPFPLLSDVNGKVAKAYGVDNLLHLFARTT